MPEPAPSRRPVALVTGASSGIGRELVRILAREGHDLVLVARDEGRLRGVADECSPMGASARVIVKDLAVLSAASEVYEELRSAGTGVDVLVNNAGLGTHGLFASIPVDMDLRLLQVNVIALTLLTKLLLPDMLSRGRGRILNVASLAAFEAGPLMATYFASKAYVLHLSEALAYEVAGRGVSVTALCPGPVRTEFAKRAGSEGKHSIGRAMDPAVVALAGYRGMMRGKRVVVPGMHTRLGATLAQLAPRKWATWAAAKLNALE